jgi:hypothetical protein
MAFFSDIVFNPKTGRHELDFVNQQYDYLMGIIYDESTELYKLNTSEEEAQRIAKLWWGRDFDTAFWLKEAAATLPERDKNPPKKS